MRKLKVEDSICGAFLERIKNPGCLSVGTIAQFTSDGMSDFPVNIAHAKLRAPGIYLATASICMRVMNKAVSKNSVKRIRPELAARCPDKVWCRD